MENKGYPVNSIRICIDAKNDETGTMQGRIYGVAIEQLLVFGNSSEMLLAIDDALDRIGKPQAMNVSRSFLPKEKRPVAYQADPTRYHGEDEIARQTGELLTKDIFFTSRQHSTWQGFVREQDDSESAFTSDLELLKYLMDKLRKVTDDSE